MIGRVPPHSVEAEEQLLSCCLLDGATVLVKCVDEKIVPQSFYVPANRVIFSHLLNMQKAGKHIEASVLAEELKTHRQLSEVGGYPYVTRISGRVPTTAGVIYFIEKLRELTMLRDIIHEATVAVEGCYSFTGGAAEFAQDIERRISSVTSQSTGATKVRGIGDFAVPKHNSDDNLLGDRYLCRGHIGMLVGGSGVGKSTIAYQKSILWALGRPAFGIKPPGGKELRSVHFQSEDEDGDIAKTRECIFYALQLTDEEKALVDDRVLIKTEKILTGDAFLADMSSGATRHKADIVWINPLQAFMEGDIKDARDVKLFARTGLNRANRAQRWAYILVHHTPKPATANNATERSWSEVMYEGAGSADLVNVCRTVIVLKATKTEGEFNLHLAKRGAEAGVTTEREGESGVKFREVLRQIPIRHSKGKFRLPGADEDTNLLFWEPRDADKPVEKKPAKQPRKRFTDGEILESIPSSHTEGTEISSMRRTIKQNLSISPETASAELTRLIEEGFVQPVAGGAVRRTPRGDKAVEHYLSTRL